MMKPGQIVVLGLLVLGLGAAWQVKDLLPGLRSPSSDNPHLFLGNPTQAKADPSQPDNYLMEKPQYVLSYNRTKGTPNWVSWQLAPNWLGDTPRQNDFRADPELPKGWEAVIPRDYSGSGFDRGHMVPSEDRGNSIADNSATFVMTNIVPQAPDNNRGPWEKLESYSRRLVRDGKELYIIAGVDGEGGRGSRGRKTRLARGKVTVPATVWKIVVVLDQPGKGLASVTDKTRVIAVAMPNQMGIDNADWRDFRTSVNQLEQATGYDFLSNLSPDLQRALQERVDSQ